MKPELQHLTDFEKVLSNYQINDEGKKLLEKTDLVLLISPTSVGRNTIINQLTITGKYDYLVSDTTRPPRMNNGVLEQDGVEYYFRTEEDMLQDLRAGKFLEAAVIHKQQVSGISLRELQKAVTHNKIAIDEIEVVGADIINTKKPDAHMIFVLPPTFEEWMRRLQMRGDMDTDEVTNRLESAEQELEAALDRSYYKFVINDKLEDAVSSVRAIVEHGEYSQADHKTASELAWKLLGQVKQKLNS